MDYTDNQDLYLFGRSDLLFLPAGYKFFLSQPPQPPN